MYMTSRPSREPGIDARIPIVFGPRSSGGSAGSQTLTVAQRWRESLTVTTFFCAPALPAETAQATSTTTTIPVRDDTKPA